MAEYLTRRRILTILGVTAAGLATGRARGFPEAIDYEWRGAAMGADAQILFCGGEKRAVHAAVRLAVAEIDRLEDVLSLFRDCSELSRLNRDGALNAPSADLRRALALGIAVARASNGLYDPTVQALWEAHVDWFSGHRTDELPPEALIAAARTRVDWRKIDLCLLYTSDAADE